MFHSLSMRSLPSDLSALTGLKYLSVGGSPNSLSEVPDSIAALTCLQHLKLHGCYLLQVCACQAVKLLVCRWQGLRQFLAPEHSVTQQLQHPVLSHMCI
jgi:hypothetical protein